MGKPKEQGMTPIRRGIKFVKRANSWCYSETYNHENTADHVEWFSTEEEAKRRLNEN